MSSQLVPPMVADDDSTVSEEGRSDMPQLPNSAPHEERGGEADAREQATRHRTEEGRGEGKGGSEKRELGSGRVGWAVFLLRLDKGGSGDHRLFIRRPGSFS